MDRLYPARLFGLGGDVVFAHDVEEILRGIAQHGVEALAGRAVAGGHPGGVMAGQRRDDLAVVAARRPPARLHRLHHRHGDAHLAQVDGGRQAREARSDDDDIGRSSPTRGCSTGPGGAVATHRDGGQGADAVEGMEVSPVMWHDP